MVLYKKTIATGLLFFNCIALAHQDIIPYEQVIAREYNRIRSSNEEYKSIQSIMSKSLRGKPIDQKNKILGDLRALKQAIHAAWLQAEHDGKRIWQWGYIWKDNNASIQALAELEEDVNTKLHDLEWESQSDIVKLLWTSSKYITIAMLGVTSLYLTQGYLSQEYYHKHGYHNFSELLLAPVQGGMHAAKTGTAYTLRGIKYGFGSLSDAAQYLDKAFSENIEPVSKKVTPNLPKSNIVTPKIEPIEELPQPPLENIQTPHASPANIIASVQELSENLQYPIVPKIINDHAENTQIDSSNSSHDNNHNDSESA